MGGAVAGVPRAPPGFREPARGPRRSANSAQLRGAQPGTVDAPTTGMSGLVRTRDLLLHGVLICRLYGLRAYLRCLSSAIFAHGRAVTFLGASWRS